MPQETPKLRELKSELLKLTEYFWLSRDKEVEAAVQKVRERNRPRVEELEKQIAAIREQRPAPKPRWPENTPANVLKACQDYWSGTAEYRSFRIHLWNDKAAWTSYPAGGYSDNGGFHPCPPCYSLISLTQTENRMSKSNRPKELKVLRFERNSGKRVTPKMMQDALDELEKGS